MYISVVRNLLWKDSYASQFIVYQVESNRSRKRSGPSIYNIWKKKVHSNKHLSWSKYIISYFLYIFTRYAYIFTKCVFALSSLRFWNNVLDTEYIFIVYLEKASLLNIAEPDHNGHNYRSTSGPEYHQSLSQLVGTNHIPIS